MDKNHPYWASTDVPTTEHLGQPIASFNPQYFRGNEQKEGYLKKPKDVPSRNWYNVTIPFEVDEDLATFGTSSGGFGWGKWGIYVYRPNYNENQAQWVLSDIKVKPKRLAGFSPKSQRIVAPLRSEIQDDELTFEVKFMNMNGDMAIETAKAENINMTGSEFELGNLGTFNESSPSTLEPYLSQSFGLVKTGSFPNEVSRFKELHIGPPPQEIADINTSLQNEHQTRGGGGSASVVQPVKLFFDTGSMVEGQAFTGSVIQADRYDYKTTTTTETSGSFNINDDLYVGGDLTGSNLKLSGNITASGITGSFKGDGSGLTGITGVGGEGIFRTTGSYKATTNDLVVTGSLTVSGSDTLINRNI